nr:zinc finger, CCHC-type [Tanacetum cinerariifolium]
GKTVNELHAMLKLHEETLPKKDANPALDAIRAGRGRKNQKNKSHKAAKGGHGKGKGKMGYASNNAPFAPKPKTPPPTKKDNPAKDAICHQCDKENYLEHPIPAAPPGQQVPPQALAAHTAWVKGKKEVVVLMLLTMDLEIQ